MSEINISELSYSEIQELLKKLNNEKVEILASIKSFQKTMTEQYSNRNFDIYNEIKNDDIPKEERKLSNVENQLFEINKYIVSIKEKTGLILQDADVELSEAEVQYIIDEYSPLADQYLNEKNYDQERVNEIGNPKDDDEYDQLREAYGDLKYNEEQFEKCAKILNYAQCYLPNEKKL